MLRRWLPIALLVGGCTLPDLSKHAADKTSAEGGAGDAGEREDGGAGTGSGGSGGMGSDAGPSGSGGSGGGHDAAPDACASAECADCDPGFAWNPITLQCDDIDECAGAIAVCDPLVTCKNTAGSFDCGACPDDYVGDGASGCAPVLTSLVASSGSISPKLQPDVTKYTLQVPIVVQQVSLTPKAPKGAVIFVNDRTVESGKSVSTPPLDLGDNTIEIIVLQPDHPKTQRYELTITRGFPATYVKASNPGMGDNFGYNIAIDGDTVVVGAPNEDGATDDASDAANAATDSGAAYVFVRSKSTWKQQAYLKALVSGQAAAGEALGASVAIDGDTIVLGAPNPTGVGAAYVFVRSGGTWTQQAKLASAQGGSGDLFGNAVALDGDTAVVGALREDSNATGTASTDAAGADNSAGDSGAAYVFARAGSDWALQAYIKSRHPDATDEFGTSVAIEGDTLVVGAPSEDGSAVGAHGDDGAEANNAALNSGAAFVYTRTGTTWSQQAYVKASNTEADDSFGWSVGISGDTIVIGAKDEDSAARSVNGSQSSNASSGSGAAFVFVRNASSWDQQAYLKGSAASLFTFGFSVAIAGDYVIVGAPYERAAYLFARDANATWSELTRIQPDPGDFAGFDVDVSGDTFVIGVSLDDSASSGVGGDASDTSVMDSGAFYVYR